MNLIIPCVGIGQRFIEDGYSIYKPLITVFGKPMILNVIDAFPENIKVWIITDEEHRPLLKEICKSYETNIIVITPHKSGPAWSLYAAAKELPLNEACFVAYNDIVWEWKYDDVIQFILKTHSDGVVFTHSGFHPHLYKNNFSAFCLTENNNLIAIKEKESFTDDWMKEDLSIGVFYFASCSLLIKGLTSLIENRITSAGEYYPSEVFNFMIKDELSINTYQTNKFIHSGIPEQLKDAEEWKLIIKSVNKPHQTPTLIMMCGTGERMKILSNKNKAGLLIDSQPMFYFVADQNASCDNAYLVNDETKSLLLPEMCQINIHIQTTSQTESLKKALDYIPKNSGLLVLSNDCYGIFDSDLLLQKEEYQMLLFGFEPRLIHRKQGNTHTGFSFSKSEVNAIHFKNIEKDDLGLAGMYYFPNAKILEALHLIDCVKSGSIDQFAEYLLNNDYNIGFVKLKHYVHLGTPEEFQEFIFWKEFYKR